jgi:mono/diheme cytochrome c family protein
MASQSQQMWTALYPGEGMSQPEEVQTPDAHAGDPKRVVIVLVVVLYALFAAAYLAGRGRFSRSPDEAFPSADFAAEDVVFDPTNIAPQPGKTVAPVDLAAALKTTPGALERGRTLFAQTCQACHGAEGRGDGAAGKGLSPPPRDFTNPSGWTRGHSLTAIFRTLTLGVKGTSMVAYDTLSPEDRFALAHAVQSFGAFRHEADTPEAVASLDRDFGLSKGSREPNRVGVPAILDRMAAEFKATEVQTGRLDQGQLLRSVIWDPARASVALSELKGWREDRGVLVRGISAGAPANGFSSSVATLSEEQWRDLHERLKRVVPEE